MEEFLRALEKSRKYEDKQANLICRDGAVIPGMVRYTMLGTFYFKNNMLGLTFYGYQEDKLQYYIGFQDIKRSMVNGEKFIILVEDEN